MWELMEISYLILNVLFGINKFIVFMIYFIVKGWEICVGYGYFVRNKCFCYNG